MPGTFAMSSQANNKEPIQLVVPTSLQMGWGKSLAFFCTASETACDITQTFQDSNTPLPKHPLENLCMPQPGMLPVLCNHNTTNFIELLKVYVNNFIGLIQAPTQQQLQHFT